MILVVLTQEIAIEPFLINELNHIKSKFPRIVIITSSNDEYRFPGATTIISKRSDFFLDCAIYSMCKIFSMESLQEFKDWKTMRVKPNLIKMIYTWFTCRMIERRLYHYFETIPKSEDIILYSYWLNQYAYCAAKAKQKYPKITSIARAHGFEVRDFQDYIPFRRVIDLYLDKIVFISEYTKNEYNKIISCIKIPKISIQNVIKLGIANHYNYQARQFSLDHTLTIVSCSGIYSLKRLDLIINSFSRLDKSIFINWVHFGTGSDFETIKQLAIKKLVSPNITFEFKGNCSNDEIFKYYETQNVFLIINLSDYEGIPVSIMEAISFGIPCMARNVGGNAEIVINKVSGILIPDEVTPEIVAKYLNNFILEMKANPTHYTNLCKSTYLHWIKNFNSEINFETFAESILIKS